MSDRLPRRPARLANRLLAGAAEIRPGEGRAVLASGLFFFVVLAAVMVLRPVREAMGLQGGIEKVRYLFLFTVGGTLLLVPAFGYLVSRVRRRVFLAVSYRGCGLILLGFYAVRTWLPQTIGETTGQVYYVYHSVFNLFVVSLFWAFMVDLFDVAESKRLFPAIAIGGTLGAIAGSAFPWLFAGRIGVNSLFLVAAALLEAAVWAAALVAHTRSERRAAARESRPIGGNPLAGITALARSPYLVAIGLLAVLGGMASTFFYFTELRLVESAAFSEQERTALFASINFWTQVGTLVAQAVVAGRVMLVLGVGVALAVMPAASGLGFAVLVASPTLTVYRIVGATCRAIQHGIARPARETLFTVVSREDKYKAKSFLDTFGGRVGDASGAQLEGLSTVLAPGLIGVGLALVPLTLLWAGLALLLGWAQTRLAGRRGDRSG